MSMIAVLRTLTLAATGLCAGAATADVFVDQAGPNNLDAVMDGSFIHVGLTPAYLPAPGVIATNVTGTKSFDSIYAWSDSVVTLNGAMFFGFDMQAHDTSVINYAGGTNDFLSVVTFDDAVFNLTGGSIGFIGTGGGTGNGGTANISGGTVTENVSCLSGAVVITGANFGTPTYGLPYSFLSFVPAGVTFVGTGVVAEYIGIDSGNGFDGNIWKLSGTLSNGGSLQDLYMVDVGIFDPTVIINYAGVTIAGSGTGDQPPVADAGVDFSVNEGDFASLDGSLSSDPDGDALTFSWVQLPGGPTVSLAGADTATPSFTAPTVAFGGETLSFQLTVTAAGVSVTDIVSVNVVNINHAPVALAGDDQTVAECVLVTLQGQDSFDVDGDVISYSWVQVSGLPVVTLSGANTANPTFVTPWVSSGGTTLVFELRVDDGFPADAPADGFELANVVDTVSVTITNQNGMPHADAGHNDCVNENTTVTLDGTDSWDPDGDLLAYTWVQIGGPSVTLSGANTATPTFQAPSVNSCGVQLKFRLTVNDGYGGMDQDTVCIQVKNVGQPPNISCARPSKAVLWPPNHQLECISIQGVSSQHGGATIKINSVRQDEPTNGTGDGDTAIDAVIKPNGTVLIRSERKGNGNGRVYHINFTATNAAGSVTGTVKVAVPKSKNSTAVDNGAQYISTQ